MAHRKLIVMLTCVAFLVACLLAGCDSPFHTGLQQSGTAFSAGDHVVVTTYGYFGNGDKLAFAIVQTWPIDTPPEVKLADKRVDFDSKTTPLIRQNDGIYREPDISGTVYMYFGDELRTMSVDMDEHTDTAGMMQLKDIDAVWAHFEKFKKQQK